MGIKLSDLATQFDLEQIGEANYEIDGVATLEKAQKHHVTFLSNSKYTSYLDTTKAGIVIVSQTDSSNYEGNKLIADDPYLAFAKIASLFQNNQQNFSGIHKTSVIDDSSDIDPSVIIGPFCIVGKNAIIKKNTVLEANVIIGDNCTIGSNCILKPQVVILYDCQLGDRVIVHPGAKIGADGFGLARDKDKWIKVPQLGAVQIGDDCEIGANTTIDRGTLEDTILEKDVRLDNQIQIAHNVQIGAHTVMAGCSAVAGSAKIGKNCFIGGGVGIIGHLEVCDNVTLQSMALVTHSIKKPGSYSSVSPLQETKAWRKSAVRIKQLDIIARKLTKLDKQLNND